MNARFAQASGRLWAGLRIAVFLSVSSAISVAAEPTSVSIPETGSVELGMAWDSNSNAVKPARCVDFAPVQSRGQTISLELSEVSDQSEVMERLGVSASAAVDAIGVGGGGAAASFAAGSNVNSTRTTLLLQATVENGVLFAGPPEPMVPLRYASPGLPLPSESDGPKESDQRHDQVLLKEWARNKLLCQEGQTPKENATGQNGNNQEKGRDCVPAVFQNVCGDSFVSAIYGGAEVLALMSFKTMEREETQKSSASLQAAFSVSGLGKAEAETKAESEAVTKMGQNDLKVTYTQLGGGEGSIPIAKEGLQQKLAGLPKEAAEAPRFYRMDVVPYSDLGNWPDVELQKSNIHEDSVIAEYYWNYSSVYDAIGYILTHPEEYPVPKSGDKDEIALQIRNEQLARLQDEVLALLKDLHCIQTEREDDETKPITFV